MRAAAPSKYRFELRNSRAAVCCPSGSNLANAMRGSKNARLSTRIQKQIAKRLFCEGQSALAGNVGQITATTGCQRLRPKQARLATLL